MVLLATGGGFCILDLEARGGVSDIRCWEWREEWMSARGGCNGLICRRFYSSVPCVVVIGMRGRRRGKESSGEWEGEMGEF